MIPYDFHYQWPSGAYLILTSFFSIFLFWKLYNARRKLTFAKGMVSERSATLYWMKAFLFSTVLALCGIALMGPVGNGHYPEGTLPPSLLAPKGSQPLQLKRKAHDVIFLLDVSASMSVTDTNLQKTRLEYAKEIADAIVAGLNGEAIALYTFTSKTQQQSPLTNDYIFIRLTLKETQINEGGIPGTDITDALAQMQKLYYPPESTKTEMSKLKTLIILTDGEDTALEALPEEQRQIKEMALANLVRGASANNLRVYTIGMGTAAGGVIPNVTYAGNPVHSHLNATLLQQIAKIGRGKYFEANRYSTPQLSKELLADIAKDPPYYEENQQEILNALLHSLLGDSGLIYDRYIQLFIGLALLCLAAALLLPDLFRKTPLFIMLFSVLHATLQSNPTEASRSTEILPLKRNLAIQEWQSEMQHAKVYVQANMFEEARSIYESLLNLPLSKAQIGVLHYNIGTTYLQQQAWAQAINQLNIAASTKDAFAFFYRFVFRNLALAYYEEALSMQKEDPLEAIKLLQLALKDSIQLQDPLKSSLENTIKVQMAQTYLVADQQKFANATPFEDLQRLFDIVSDAQEQLNFLIAQPMNKELFKSYSILFVQEQDQLLPLWKEHIEKARSPEQKKLLKKAEGRYREMINLIEKSESSKVNFVSEALSQAMAAQHILLELLEQMSHGPPIKGMLHQLLNAYERLLRTKKWKKERLKILLELFSDIQNHQTSNESELIKARLLKSQQQLNEAIIASQTGNLRLANLLAHDSAQQIRLTLVLIPPVASMDILKGLIQQQNYLLDLEAESLKMHDGENSKIEFTILHDGQGALLQLCELYFQTLYQEQVDAFRQNGLCQSVPWSEALPHFESGKLAAIKANELLQKEGVDINAVIEYQTQAVENWQKAMEEIKHPSTKRTPCFDRSTSQMSPENTSGQLENSLTSLLQMEQEDRLPAEPERIQQSNVQRPW